MRPLRWPEVIGYGVGDMGFNFYWKTFEYFLLYFYTDVFGISAAQAGTMFLVTRVWDAVNDPIMGIVADRTRTRWGKFRPYLLWMALPLAAAGVLTFTTPDLDSGGKIAWAYATYIVMMMIYTAANIPYGAMLGVITPDVTKRTTLSTVRMVAAFTGGVVVTAMTKHLVGWLGGGNAERGWQLTMGVYGAIGIVLLLISFASTRERVAPPPGQKTSVRADLGDLVRNGPWVTLLILGFLVIITIAVRNGTGIYYLKYYAGREDLIATFLTASSVAYTVGAACTPLLTRYFDKKRIFIFLMVAVAVLSSSLFFVPPDAIGLIIGINVATSLVLGPKSPLTWAMFADSADFSEWRTGRRATGLVFSAGTFATKLGGAMAGALTGWLLQSVGYIPNQQQSPGALAGILWLASVIPAGFAIAAAFVARAYSLDGQRMSTIQRELETRRTGD